MLQFQTKRRSKRFELVVSPQVFLALLCYEIQAFALFSPFLKQTSTHQLAGKFRKPVIGKIGLSEKKCDIHTLQAEIVRYSQYISNYLNSVSIWYDQFYSHLYLEDDLLSPIPSTLHYITFRIF